MNIHHFLFGVLLVVILGAWIGEGCFIIDCPDAHFYTGKREVRQCPSCGPGGMGVCMTSQVCCIPGGGCVIGRHAYTASCQRESRFLQQCASSSVTRCSTREPNNNSDVPGVCAMDGLCCTSLGTCHRNEECRNGKEESIRERKDLFVKALNRLRRISLLRAHPSDRPNRTRFVIPDIVRLYDDNDIYRS